MNNSRKFFSLIHGEHLHIAPKTKVVSAAAFSSLLDAQEVLKKVQEDAAKYREEVIKECEQLKENAKKDGFEEGFRQWAEQLANLEEEIANVRKEVEKIVAPAALKAAKKIVGREMELSSNAIADIVANVLKAVAQHKKITIYANKNDIDALEKNKGKLKEVFESLESLSIRERDDVKSGGCIIETEAGIINAQLDSQWRVLEQAFEKMMKGRSNGH